MSSLFLDFRYAVRTLAKSPGFTAIAVLCLGLGIGANTTVFSTVNGLLLRPLPFADPGKLVAIHTADAQRPDREGSWSYPNLKDFGNGDGAFSSVGAWDERTVNVSGSNEPIRVDAARVSSSLFPTLGLSPAMGRFFREDEELEGTVVVLSDGLWRSAFGADAGIIGKTVRVNDRPHTVIGVMGAKLHFPETAQLWLPLEPGDMKSHRDWTSYEIVGRLAAGVSADQASRRAGEAMKRLVERFPAENKNVTAWAQPYREVFVGTVRPVLVVMLGAVGFVLLIACANVANLLLARATSRQREIAVRVSLGASRSRIIRQLLAESVILAALGGVAGALIGTWGMDAIRQMIPPGLPFWMEFPIDRSVLVYTFAVALVTSLVFGIAPAIQASAVSLTETLKDGGRGATMGTRAGRLRGALVIGQVALSMVLLVGASLMIKSFVKLQTVNPGFRREGVMTLNTALAGPRFEADSVAVAVYRDLVERVRALPTVVDAGVVSNLPIRRCCSETRFYPEGTNYAVNEGPRTLYNIASPGFFPALGVPLLAGRIFTEADVDGREAVAMVSSTLAQRAFPGNSPLGKRISLGHPSDTASTMVTIVGVVPDVKQQQLSDESRAQVWRPHAQVAARSVSLVVRTSGPPEALAGQLRAVVREIDPNLPVTDLITMNEVIAQRMFEPRVYSIMFAAFAVAALVLATIGLYGVLAYLVSQRTHEFGIRMALGAESRDVIHMVIRDGAKLTGIGLLIGIPSAVLLSGVLHNLLYGVQPGDPAAILGVTVLFAIVALTATLVPARRATHVDPMIALRSD